MSTASSSVASLEGIRLDYRHGEGWMRVIDEVSLGISRGEIVGLVGESGCGKSTLASLLLGYRYPNARVGYGRVIFEGKDLLELDRPALDRIRGRRISLIPQDPTTALNPSMRVGEQVAEVFRVHGLCATRSEATTRVIEIFRSVRLPEPARLARRYPQQLSGGQQQRVTIAMALACNPTLVVLDEPTTGLDVTTQDQILRLLVELRSRFGMAMLYVTHDLGVVAQIADRVIVMYAGHVVETASTVRIFQDPRHPYTRGLIATTPRIDQDGEHRRKPMRGLLRRSELPPGCSFEPRCDFNELACAENRQRLEVVEPDHLVACQRWRDVAADTVVTTKKVAPVTLVAPTQKHRETLLELEGVTLRYASHNRLTRLTGRSGPNVVHDISLSIGRSEVFALVGESGSGKTTIAKAISGLLAPVSGRLLLEGNVLPRTVAERSRDLKRRIQYIFQNPDASLNPRSRVRTALARPLIKFFFANHSEISSRVSAVLDKVRLPKVYADRYPDQLSGGERQRVAFARALVAEPDLLICDEVLSALDVSVQANILGLLEELKRDTAVTILFISHDLAVVSSLADRVAVLFQGHLCEVGEKDDVFAPPYHPYTFSLLQAVPGIEKRGHSAWNVPEVDGASGTGMACAFAGRCTWQLGTRCEEVPPPWREAGETLRIRCHHELDELVRRSKDRAS